MSVMRAEPIGFAPRHSAGAIRHNTVDRPYPIFAATVAQKANLFRERAQRAFCCSRCACLSALASPCSAIMITATARTSYLTFLPPRAIDVPHEMDRALQIGSRVNPIGIESLSASSPSRSNTEAAHPRSGIATSRLNRSPTCPQCNESVLSCVFINRTTLIPRDFGSAKLWSTLPKTVQVAVGHLKRRPARRVGAHEISAVRWP
jgi:hypothetical protein